MRSWSFRFALLGRRRPRGPNRAGIFIYESAVNPFFTIEIPNMSWSNFGRGLAQLGPANHLTR